LAALINFLEIFSVRFHGKPDPPRRNMVLRFTPAFALCPLHLFSCAFAPAPLSLSPTGPVHWHTDGDPYKFISAMLRRVQGRRGPLICIPLFASRNFNNRRGFAR
jgi:hypothetical protein